MDVKSVMIRRMALLGEKVSLIGADLSKWRDPVGKWKVVADAAMNPANEKLLVGKEGPGAIINGDDGRTVYFFSKAEFGDCVAHIEFMVPKGSNSGVYFQGRYEIQILDSWGVEKPKHGDCGGIYQRWKDNKGYDGIPPRVNASLEPGKWQSFDAIFKAPLFDPSGKKIKNAEFVKVLHNGVVVHTDAVCTGPTRAAQFGDEKPVGPLMLQGDHGPVAFRNIWVIPIKN